MTLAVAHEPVAALAGAGVTAFVTTRQAGTFGTNGTEPVAEVMGRWQALVDTLGPLGPRLATAHQVHGVRVVVHHAAWEGWLRVRGADGHVAATGGTALAVTIADCVPVFIAHPSGVVALLHAGWRGTAGGILREGLAALERLGLPAGDLALHLGPAICGRCYEVGPDVHRQLTGRDVAGPAPVDLRAILAAQAHAAGVRNVSVSAWCTRCDNDRFYSHRAGDAGRQLAVVIASR